MPSHFSAHEHATIDARLHLQTFSPVAAPCLPIAADQLTSVYAGCDHSAERVDDRDAVDVYGLGSQITNADQIFIPIHILRPRARAAPVDDRI